jgi:hypothetical protein
LLQLHKGFQKIVTYKVEAEIAEYLEFICKLKAVDERIKGFNAFQVK